MNQLRSLPISHLGPLFINHLGNKPHQCPIAQCVWYGTFNVSFCILHVLYDMGILKPPLVVLNTGSVSFYIQDNGLIWAQLCAMILESINQTNLATVTFNVTTS